jgi:hypothetical protein
MQIGQGSFGGEDRQSRSLEKSGYENGERWERRGGLEFLFDEVMNG